MNVARSLWASIQSDPRFMRRVNGWLTIFWIAMIPISFWLGWLDSVTYVSALSLWALVSGHWSAWQAARVEVRQEAELQAAADRDLPGEVVDRLVDEVGVDSGRDHSSEHQAGRPRRGATAAPRTDAGRASAVATGTPTPACTCDCHAVSV